MGGGVWTLLGSKRDSHGRPFWKAPQDSDHELQPQEGLSGGECSGLDRCELLCYPYSGYTDTLEKEEVAKSLIAGTTTGLLFKSTSGSLAKCAKGGLLGLGISAVWAFGLRKQETVQNYI